MTRAWLVIPFIAAVALAIVLIRFDRSGKGDGKINRITLIEEQRHLLGTRLSVKLYVEDRHAGQAAVAAAFAEAARLQQILSAHDAASDLAALNDAPALVPQQVAPELAEVIALAMDMAAKSEGIFDPTLGPCIRLWKRSCSRGELPDARQIAAARQASGYQKLLIDGQQVTKTVPGMRIDLGGIAKGYIVDQMARLLREAGCSRFCVSSTSDIIVGDPPPGKQSWSVALGDDPRGALIPLKNKALSTSGPSHQYVDINGRRYSHIIDPRTGLGSTETGRAVTVTAPSAALADALATVIHLGGERFGPLLESCHAAVIHP